MITDQDTKMSATVSADMKNAYTTQYIIHFTCIIIIFFF